MPRPMTILAEGPQPGQKVSPMSEQNVAPGVALNAGMKRDPYR